MRTTKFLIIAGMHRSGTSVVAQAFFRAGLFLGDKLVAPSAFNPDGYFEDEDIIQFHEEILAVNQASWHAYKALKNLTVPDDYKTKGAELIRVKFGSRSLCGWKDPRTTLFLDFWKTIIPEAKYIFVFRRPSEVVWSLLRRGDLTRYSKNPIVQALIALRLWNHYNRRILTFVQQNFKNSLLLFIPWDLNEKINELVNKVINEQWSLMLGTVDLLNVYSPRLLKRKTPWWITCLANLYLPAPLLLWRLKRLRSRLLASYLGQEGTLAFKERGEVIQDKKHVVCIISPNKNAYSETFIRAHIERLPARVKVLYGGYFPTYTEDGKRLLPSTLPQRAMRYALRKLLHLSPEYFQTKALRRFLRANKVDAVLAEYGPTGVSVMEACRAEDIPLIVHFHGFDAFDHKTLEQYGSAYKRMFSLAAAIVAVSRDMEKQLLALGAPRERLFYNPYGVDISLFSGAEPASAPPVFVAVGRFVDKKAPHLTLLAFKKVVDAYPEARLIMIGDGELWEACKQLARALKVADAVEFLGVRSPAEVAFTLRKARAFVQHSLKTSYGDSEGTPVAVLEAGATGLPVVSTYHGGIKDVVIDGETGFLVDEGDIDAMADRMLKLARDPELAARMGKRARERICAEFSMEKSIGRLWEIIKKAIQKKEKA